MLAILYQFTFICYRLIKLTEAIDRFGAGVGGPPLLNGYTPLHREFEESLSYLKSQEDTLLFSSDYSAKVGLINGLVDNNDSYSLQNKVHMFSTVQKFFY